jgi:hypothetical protein
MYKKNEQVVPHTPPPIPKVRIIINQHGEFSNVNVNASLNKKIDQQVPKSQNK